MSLQNSKDKLRNYRKEQEKELKPDQADQETGSNLPKTMKSVMLETRLSMTSCTLAQFRTIPITVFPDFVHYYYQASTIFNELFNHKETNISCYVTPPSCIILSGYALLYVTLFSESKIPEFMTKAARNFFTGPQGITVLDELSELSVPRKLAVILETYLPTFGDTSERTFFFPSLDTVDNAADGDRLIPPWVFCKLHDALAISNDHIKLVNIDSDWPAGGDSYSNLLFGVDEMRELFGKALESANVRYFNRRNVTSTVGMPDIIPANRAPYDSENIYEFMIDGNSGFFNRLLKVMNGVSNWFVQIGDSVKIKDLVSMNGSKILDHCLVKSKLRDLNVKRDDIKCTGFAYSQASLADKVLPVCGGKVIQQNVNFPVLQKFSCQQEMNDYLYKLHHSIVPRVYTFDDYIPIDGAANTFTLKRTPVPGIWSSYRYRNSEDAGGIFYLLHLTKITDQPKRKVMIRNYYIPLLHGL